MSRRARIFRTYLRTELAMIVEYRAAVYVWMLASSMPILMMLVWRHLAADGEIGGYAAADFSRYFLIGFFMSQVVQVWVVWNFDEQIRTGTLAIGLLRPVDPYLHELATNLAGNGFRLPVTVGATLAGLTAFGAIDGVRWARLPLFLLAAAGGWGIFFNLNYALALLGLWTERVRTLEPWSYLLLAVCGGALFPLDLLPERLGHLIALTPFPSVINFPVRILTQELADGEAARGLLAQAVWIGVLVLAHRLLWRAGLRKFGAVGG